MDTKEPHRHWTAEQKLKIVQEGRQSGQMVSEVCRRYQIAPRLFYLWEKQAQQGALEALQNRRPGRKTNDATTALENEIDRLRMVVVELSSENLELKRGLCYPDTATTALRTRNRS
ncbi:MAG: IS2 repressor TnpA [Chloroflexi bacterium ADurb.Bin180]|nr:MAG: IS2 repressor TnpA [Chloroflexi bacterium ADurb.Bin180]